MKCSYGNIAFEHIHDTRTYDIHPFLLGTHVQEALVESIILTGILNPPLLLQTKENEYDIISGRQRLKCAESVLNSTSCFCRLLPPEASSSEILTCFLEDQYLHNPLTIIEQAHFIELCFRLLPEKRVLKTFFANLPQGRITYGSDFLRPLILFDTRIQYRIHSALVSDKILGILCRFEPADQLTITDLIEKLQLGGNNQKKMLQYLFDIVRREEISLAALLENDKMKEILSHPYMTVPQKAARFTELLYQMCYPLYSSAQEKFDANTRAIGLPPFCRLQAAKSFEKEEVNLSITFKNLTAFESVWPDFDIILKKIK